jgi:hypothetical protein
VQNNLVIFPLAGETAPFVTNPTFFGNSFDHLTPRVEPAAFLDESPLFVVELSFLSDETLQMPFQKT